MNTLISIQNLGYAYGKNGIHLKNPPSSEEDQTVIFDDFSLTIPEGISSIMGQNGIGKSTLLMLMGARLFPQKGNISIRGTDIKEFFPPVPNVEIEEERNRLVSFVYQNMEFENDESLEKLLDLVQEGNPDNAQYGALLADIPRALELGTVLGKRLQELSKGTLQRAIIALAVSYGSRILMMDEPIFALEDSQKKSVFSWLGTVCRTTGTSLIFSAHDMEICRDYADTMLLLFPGSEYRIGPATEIGTRENLEAAYRVPLETLYQKERLYRDMLIMKSTN